MNKPVMTAEIVRIGNSKGLRIPKAIREQIGLEGKVTLTVSGDTLVVRAKRNPRAGWAEAIKRAKTDEPDDARWPEGIVNKFDETEWTW